LYSELDRITKGKLNILALLSYSMEWEPEYIVIDNFLSDEDFKLCMNQIELHRDQMKDFEHESGIHYRRWQPGPTPFIKHIIGEYLYNDRIYDIADNFIDGFWKQYCENVSNKYECQVTSYTKDRKDFYGWHTDHIPVGLNVGIVRNLNYILYMTDIDNGGEFQIANEFKHFDYSYEPEVHTSISPKRNRLLLIPTWYIHRVTPVLSDQERLTIHGHTVTCIPH